MPYPLRYLSLATATLLLTPLLAVTSSLSLVVRAQTIEQQEPGAEQWFSEAYQLWLKGKYPDALAKLQQDLVTFKNKGNRARVGAVLASIAMVYRTIGEYTQALEYSQKALVLFKEIDNLPNSEQRSIARIWQGRTFTNLSLTNFNRQPQAMKILVCALTEAATVKVGEKTYNFSALPAAGKEVENLASTIPNTTKLIGRDFNQTETLGRISGYSMLHLATHAAFVIGKPEDSFIVFGNNDRATFSDAQTWTLKNLDLVVLSACETGLGGKLGHGEEILGFGYLMQEAGARASIASLWTVDDSGTQVFMNALYRALQSGKMTKTEALRQAQIALITGDEKALGEARSLISVKPLREQVSTEVANRLNHPYYWAPFILIGNGL